MKNQIPGAADDRQGGTPECGFSNPNAPAQPLPDHIEFGNYNLQNPSGLHPGPCEAWCDNAIVIPFTDDCRTLFQKPIPYAKDKCVGKSRFTLYWLATHFAPFQVHIGCAPFQSGASNNTAPATPPKPAPAPAPKPRPAPAPAPAPAPVPKPATTSPAPDSGDGERALL